MFARSVARAAPRSSALPSTATRSYRTIPGPMACLNARPQLEKKSIAPQQIRAASEHAIANPTLAGIEKRWEGMPPQEQAELWMQLRDRMKVDWHQMTLQEKKAGGLIFFFFLFSPSLRIFLSILFTILVVSRPNRILLMVSLLPPPSLLDRFRRTRPSRPCPQG